jgi:hypothetical protein
MEPGQSDKPPSLREWFEQQNRYRHGIKREPWEPMRCKCGKLLRECRSTDCYADKERHD